MAEYIEKFWRDATDKDVVRVMAGEAVEARFRDVGAEPWCSPRELRGCKTLKEQGLRWISPMVCYSLCQVYSPPQWWLDKPDPGEGFRLLGKFPDEALQPGDEFFEYNQWWPIFFEDPYPQVEGIWYRRKIEQPKPEPKFAVGQRVKIVGPKRTDKVRYNWEQGMDNQVGKTGVVTGSHDGSFGRLYQLSGIVEWNFQEEYLEAVVEPEPKHYVLQVGDTADTGNGFSLTVTEHGVEIT